MNTQEYDTSRAEAKKLYLSKFKSKKKLLVYEHEIFDFAYKRGFEAAEKDYEKGENPPARKFKSGDKVRYNGQVYEIGDYVGRNRYTLKGVLFDIDEDMLDPLSETTNQSRNLSQDSAICDKDHAGENIEMVRLKVAAMAMHGLLASPVDANMQSKSVEYITEASFEYADALLAKANRGG